MIEKGILVNMNNHYEFVNTPLAYEKSALEPFIDAKTMELHHDKHLQNYIDQLNRTLKDYPELYKWTLEQLIYNADRLPAEIRTPVKRNAGGVYNHRFYFNGLTPKSTREPTGELRTAIEETFGGYDGFHSYFKEEALALFGSGYAWLCMNSEMKLCIISTANQNTPLTRDLWPILTIDVWEHAYYLKHYNKRVDYIEDWFQVVNWAQAEENYIVDKTYCF